MNLTRRSWLKLTGGSIRAPDTPGMGLELDLDYLKTATVIAKIDKPARAGSTG